MEKNDFSTALIHRKDGAFDGWTYWSITMIQVLK